MRAARLALILALAPLAAAAQDAAILSRLDAYESELRRLTAQVEDLERRLAEAERRNAALVEDLEFRVTELEGGDPMAAFGSGGEDAFGGGGGDAAPGARDEAPAAAPRGAPEAGPGAPPAPLGELAVSQDAGAAPAYEAAMRDLEALGPEAGRDSVDRFLAAHPDSPLAGRALNRVGESFMREGRWREAARSFYLGVRDHPAAERPANLLGLGQALASLGETDQACGAFAEIGRSHPGAIEATEAADAARALGCP